MSGFRASEPLTLSRDCPAILIPSGEPVTLRHDEIVSVVQRLGATITIRTEWGLLARIDQDHLDALGLTSERVTTPSPAPACAPGSEPSGGLDLDVVLDQLRGVFDPEIPINVVDLGLIYDLDAKPLPHGGYRVEIAMSMTAPGCGMGDVLADDARCCIESLPEVVEVAVRLVWDPPWTLERMSDAARLELGLL